MSFLYGYAWWRAIVAATRDPKKLVVITCVSSAGFGAVAYGIQGLTGRVAEGNMEKMRGEVTRDREASRYASHSKRALEVILADATGKDKPDHKYPMKMPQVHWHPGALKKSQTDTETTQTITQTTKPQAQAERIQQATSEAAQAGKNKA